MDRLLFDRLLFFWMLIGAIVFVALLFVSAPYGRHSKRSWGPMISNRLAWVLMEMPSLVFFVFFFLYRSEGGDFLKWIFFVLWLMHYANRSLVFPFRTKTAGKKMPVLIALFAVVFNLVNGSFNGYYFAHFSSYTIEWLYDVRFVLGMMLFVVGVLINQFADKYLLSLRDTKGNGYKIPQHRLFKYVSCPNFSGEILEWTGFAIMTWSPAAAAFALWSIFNLVPRAIDHHLWYKENFEDYPAGRKAVIPFLL